MKRMLQLGMRFSRVILIIALSLSFACTPRPNTDNAYKWVYSTVLHCLEKDTPYCTQWQYFGREGRQRLAHRYAQVITNVCHIYELNYKIFTKHCQKESNFRYWIVSSKGAVGAWQVIPSLHAGRLYRIQNGELGKYLHKRRKAGKKINHKRYFKRIGYCGHAAGSLQRDWLNKFKTYPVMLSAFISGPNTEYTKELSRNPLLLHNSNNQLYRTILEIVQ